jgi:putative ABC transport system permease protein
VGAALGRWNTANYAEFFRFPFLYYRPSGLEFLLSAAIGCGVALLGALGAARRAATLPPAEAMRPPAPEMFRHAGVPPALARRLDNPTRMILRQIVRTPGRAAVTVAGVALAVGVLVTAMQWSDSIGYMAKNVFEDSQRQDIVVGFHEVRPDEARFALARLPGVLSVEPLRIVPTKLRAGSRVHRGAITGLAAGGWMQPIRDMRGWILPVPAGGLVLGTALAEKLGVAAGDTVEVETLGGARRRFELPVAALVETLIGTPAYMDLGQLNRQLRDPPVFEYAALLIDPAREAELFAVLEEVPGVSAVMIKRHAIASMLETMGETILIFISFFIGFAGALAYGVIYNAVRIALSERGRELATLRVLGFTRWEISYILIGEAALLVLVALPIGCLVGYALAAVIAESMATELFRVPMVVTPAAFGKAALVILAASLLSAAIVRRRLDRLDLVAVLKTRE